ncbi:TcfC E-set like domain-containing protein [Vibrio parahaemolyticus]|uniref:CS1-pili formation C-terminal domain-containing protein n=1 Tax=Vibrio parahaemolyticus TaxID=670 RepID=UPI001EEA7F73|nr:TcfC E-set like domain-containing protein [Vibrio parahaemolyticus]MCG6461984.1 TcfC E-set like domain-containing protein [Vibrio parahaemolyticus]
MISNKGMIAAAIIFYSSVVFSSNSNIIIPDEFSDMFEGAPVLMAFQIGGVSSSSEKIMMEATPLLAKLSPPSKTKLESYLSSQGVRKSAIDLIISDMTSGIKNDELCSGLILSCKIIPEKYAFGYDYERKTVLLFLNADLVKKSKKSSKPHESHNKASGLVNHIDINANYYQNGDGMVTVRDDTIWGIPYGNFQSSIYTNTDNDFDVDQLSYNYEWGTQRFQVGHYKYGYAHNTTGMLDLSGSYPMNVVSFSSSQNLVSSDLRKQRQLSYFLPGQGRIEVYRDERLVLGKNVSSGQQNINYSDLPSGNYLATVIVLSQGKEIFKEQRQIYNTAMFSLAQGDFDYALSIGELEDRYDDNTDFDELVLASGGFADGRLNYQFLDNTLLGARAVATQDNNVFEAIISQEIGEHASIVAKHALFDNDASYWSIDGSLLGIALGYEHYDLYNDDYSLNNYMLGNTGYRRFSASTSAAFLGGSGYLMYIDNCAKNDALLGSQFNDQASYWSLTTGFSRPFVVGSTLDLSLSWQGNRDERFNTEDKWYASILWTVPLGSEWRGMSSASFSKEGVDEFRNSVAKDVFGDNYYANTEIGVSYNGSYTRRSMTADASFSGGYTSRAFNSDTYLYAKSDGTKSANIGFSSSQVFDGNNVYFSSEKSDAYVIVDADNKDDKDQHLGLLTISNDGQISQYKNIDNNKTVIPVDNYNQYKVHLDTESSNYIVNGRDENEKFSFPGSVISLSVDLTKIKTFITSFEDIRQRNVEDIQCEGDGCVDVEKLTDGVFKVSVIVGADYQLVAQNQTCITPTLDRKTSRIVNLGVNYCLPGIDNDSVQLASLQNVNLGDSDYYFVGVYQSDQDLSEAKQEVESTGLEVTTRSVGSRHYLYAIADGTLTLVQRQQLDTLWRVAMRTLQTDKWVLWR